jgi:hypothetical protein
MVYINFMLQNFFTVFGKGTQFLPCVVLHHSLTWDRVPYFVSWYKFCLFLCAQLIRNCLIETDGWQWSGLVLWNVKGCNIPCSLWDMRIYDLELLRRLCIIKSSRATSRVRWLNGEKKTTFRGPSPSSSSGYWSVFMAARSHEHGARAGIYMTRMGTPAASVPWGRGRRWSSKRWLFRHSTIWRGW